MQISNNNINFRALYIHKSFYDASDFLSRNKYTRNDYCDAYQKLQEACVNKNVEIMGIGDCGVAVVEVDDRGSVVKYITKNLDSIITGMKQAARKLNNENKPKKERKKMFEGHN